MAEGTGLGVTGGEVGRQELEEQGRPGLAGASAAWGADPRLADVAWRLVLDGDGARILDMSEGARAAAMALAPDGRLGPVLARQIVQGAGNGPGPRIALLRLDRTGLAKPSLCLLARGAADDGRPVILLATDSPPVLRRGPDPRPERPAAQEAAPPPSDPEPAAPTPRQGDRFLWRSDVSGALTQLSNGQDALAPFIGRSWETLAKVGSLHEADALLAALAEQRTFRALPVSLDLSATGPRLDADLSGAPLARAAQPFSGYGGFGVVRSVGAMPVPAVEPAASPDVAVDVPFTDAGPAPTTQAAPPLEEAPAASTPGLASDPMALATLAAPLFAAWFAQPWFGGDRGRGASPAAEPRPSPEMVPERATAAAQEPAQPSVPQSPDASSGSFDPDEASGPEALPEAEPDSPQPAEPASGPASASGSEEPALSSSEHAAFREIARALGARYAGDETSGDGAEPGERVGGSVTPFPGPRGDVADPLALLEALPLAILVHRGDAVLAATRALRDLTGYASLDLLQAAGLDRLFRGLPPERHASLGAAPVPLAIEAADGTCRAIELERAQVPWSGGPATALLMRPVRSDAPARIYRDGGGIDARAALDLVADGVAVLDEAGRVLSLNRAASVYLGGEAREFVGSAFETLLPESGPFEAALGAADGTARVIALPGGRAAIRFVRLAPDRVAALLREPESPAAEPARAPARFLGQLDRGVRTPLTAILGFADAMLSETDGPLGHARYRAYLQDIHAAGEQVLSLVSDLVELARLEAGGETLTATALPLNDLVAACVADLQPEASKARILLRTSFSEDLAPLQGDAATLGRAARLVIANAIRLTGAGGQVIVSTMPAENDGVALRVRDTGGGMTPEELAFALEPLHGAALPRADLGPVLRGGGGLGGSLGSGGASGPGRGFGSGLGLPLTRALVEANAGSLRISSRKDEGTLVEILLPARRA